MSNSTSPENSAERKFDVRPTSDSHFSWVRTRLSLERTMMSWMRTAVSLIGFGFTIVQFFDRVQTIPGAVAPRFPDAPRYLGLAMIFCGVMALVIAIWEYRWSLGYLWSGDFRTIAGATPRGKLTPIYATSVALIFVGLFAFVSLSLRLI